MIIARFRAFAMFWYDFVIGDDWLVAAGVVLALAGTYFLVQAGHPGSWWLILVAVGAFLPISLWRAIRK